MRGRPILARFCSDTPHMKATARSYGQSPRPDLPLSCGGGGGDSVLLPVGSESKHIGRVPPSLSECTCTSQTHSRHPFACSTAPFRAVELACHRGSKVIPLGSKKEAPAPYALVSIKTFCSGSQVLALSSALDSPYTFL